MNNQKKIQYFNNLRAIACFLVILTHSAMPSVDVQFGYIMAFFSLLGSPSSELFVTLSSSLLAPSKDNMFTFYKKRFSKLLGPFFIWSIITIVVDFILSKITLKDFFNNFLLIPIKPVIGVYWFVYVICGLYLIIPLISPWLKNASKKELKFVLLIWGITLLLPYLNIFYNSSIYVINGDYNFIFSYLGGFIGYLFLGVYLRKYPIKGTNFKIASIIFTLILIALIPYAFGYLYNEDILTITRNNLSISSASFVIAIFIFFQNFNTPINLNRLLNFIAKHSFGIFLMHILVRNIFWYLLKDNRLFSPLIETPLIAVSTLFVSIVFVFLISKLPGSKYIIGI